MKELLRAGYRTGLLEAMPTAGGRISTLTEPGFDQPVETGAEFIHGKLPLTRKLLDDAGIKYHRITDWRGYLFGGFALVWIANTYISLFGLLRQGLKKEKITANLKEVELKEVKQNTNGGKQQELS
ncbi:hypothetical protein OSTOST_13561 [Ostertagia ostertagi]